MPKVCVIIPAFNEEKTISDVIMKVRQNLPKAEIVVINDGSEDTTAEVASRAGANVVQLPFNLGIGGAVQTGLKYAYQNDFDLALEIDADGQHDPKHAREMIDKLFESGSDMLIGSRFIVNTEYRASVMRWFGIHACSWLIKMVAGHRIYDPTSGYRAYSKRALKFLVNRYPLDFPEPESIVLMLHNGFMISEIPVEMHERKGGESVIGKNDWSLKGAYFVISNLIAILLTGLRVKIKHA